MHGATTKIEEVTNYTLIFSSHLLLGIPGDPFIYIYIYISIYIYIYIFNPTPFMNFSSELSNLSRMGW